MTGPSKDDQRNLILAAVLSFAVILLWQVFVIGPQVEAQRSAEAARQEAIAAQAGATATPDATVPGALPSPGATAFGAQPLERDAALAASGRRLTIDTPALAGSLPLRGGRIDEMFLKRHRVAATPGAEPVEVLWPHGTGAAYFAEFGWAGAGGVETPTAQTDWLLAPGSPDRLAPGKPVTLIWDNARGVRFTRVLEIDERYLLTVTQRVENRGAEPARLTPIGQIERHTTGNTLHLWVVHEGPIGVFDGALASSIDYDDLEDGEPLSTISRGQLRDVERHGWLGFTDHYWMSALAPAAPGPFRAVFETKTGQFGEPVYFARVIYPEQTVAPGATAEVKTRFFVGAKEIGALRNYQYLLDGVEEPTTILGKTWDFFFYTGTSRFVDAIDWGWFFFLTKPIFEILMGIQSVVGNMGVSIILLTVLFKTLLFPLAYKSFVSMSKLKKLQPEMKKIQERAGDDKQRMQQEMLALYKRERVNPASGCLPILVQIPIFFSLYKVLIVTIEIRHAPFFAWVQDLSAPDPTSIFNLFGLLPYDVPAFLLIGVWPVLMGLTMWIQQMLNPAPTDPVQEKIFNLLPLMFTFMLGTFASGLVIYWTANNLLTILQQYTIMRSQGVAPDILGNIRRQLGLAPKPAGGG